MMSNKTWLIVAGGLFLAGCGADAPEARYSGNTLAAKEVDNLQVFRAGQPDRPFAELGTVDVSCPTDQTSTPFGPSNLEGGCTFDQALGMATLKAAASGADAIYALHTTAARNGNVVSMTAVAVRFTGPKPAAPADVAPLPSKPAAPALTVEQRLQKLKELNEQKLITNEEYSKRKAEILQSI
jgi:hypothetical protein